jgi:heme/copper-type cytochrome/quinol oxidase subunit 2
MSGSVKEVPMGIGTSMVLVAAGAILDFAIDVHTQNYNLHTIGLILMIVGILGLVMSLLFWSSWGAGGFRRTAVYEDEVPPRRRRIVRDEML